MKISFNNHLCFVLLFDFQKFPRKQRRKKFFFQIKNQSCEKGEINRPATKISKGDCFIPSSRPKKKIPILKNLFPLRKKKQKNFPTFFSPIFFFFNLKI